MNTGGTAEGEAGRARYYQATMGGEGPEYGLWAGGWVAHSCCAEQQCSRTARISMAGWEEGVQPTVDDSVLVGSAVVLPLQRSRHALGLGGRPRPRLEEHPREPHPSALRQPAIAHHLWQVRVATAAGRGRVEGGVWPAAGVPAAPQDAGRKRKANQKTRHSPACRTYPSSEARSTCCFAARSAQNRLQKTRRRAGQTPAANRHEAAAAVVYCTLCRLRLHRVAVAS